MSSRTKHTLALAVVLACVTGGVAANALPPEPKDWEGQIKLYGWASALQTEVEAGGVETTIDESFFDILDVLGWAVMGGVEGRYKRGLVMVDFLGMQVATGADGPGQTFPFELPGGRDGLLTAGPVGVSTRLTTWMIDTKFGVRALSFPMSKLTGSAAQDDDLRRFDFDLLAGFRVWNVTSKLHVGVDPASLTVGGAPVSLPGILPGVDFGDIALPGPLLSGGSRTVEETVDWLDPIVGFRVSADVTDRISLMALGDIGGWGVGTASELTWQGMIGGSFDLSEHWSLTAAYRALGVNRDSAIKNTILYGPQFGAVFRF
jgi:hypothetical protein